MQHPSKGSFSGEFIDVRITDAFTGFYGLRPELGTSEEAVPGDNPASPILTSSKLTVTHAQLLLKECVASHSKCGGSSKPPNSSFPTRLIHIDEAGPQKIRLQSSHHLPPDTRYTTLSYCWGPTKPGRTRLERKCVTQFTAGIPFPQLPKTIREAIHFTYALGIQYIWVDLLCIIQDSEEDMAKEITAMHKIYENGYLNLSALSSDCMEKGLYAQRNPLQYCPVVIGSDGDDNGLLLLPNDDWVYNWPSHLRGWIFQERTFSRRTLYFGPYLVWVCQQTSRHEFQREISPKYTIGPRFRYLLSQPFVQESEKWAFYLIWHEILEAYLDTKLGRQKDRLLAIKGHIADIEERTKWKNVMGL